VKVRGSKVRVHFFALLDLAFGRKFFKHQGFGRDAWSAASIAASYIIVKL